MRISKERIVVKVGTSTLVSGNIEPSATFHHVAESISKLTGQYDVALVTSGAIGFGMRQVGLDMRPEELHKLQALSMIGQVGLLREWREGFHDMTIGQVLVTRHDLELPGTSGLFRASVEEVWNYDAIPVINENDAVSTEEISFGDNDRLAAEVAVTLGAQMLFLLTDQDGIQSDFGGDAQQRIPTIPIDEVDAYISTVPSQYGKGGASSKIQAARIALKSGVSVYIAKASDAQAIEQALSGNVGTKVIQ